MSITYRGFEVLIADSDQPNATIIATLGSIILSVVSNKIAITGNATSPDNPLDSWLDTYVDDRGAMTSVCLYSSTQDISENFVKLTQMIPVARQVDLSAYAGMGYHLWFKNASGYYLEGLLGTSLTGQLTMRDPEGASMGLSGFFIEYYTSSKTIVAPFWIADFSDPDALSAIAGGRAYVSNSGTKRYYIQTISTSQKPQVSLFLNNTEQYVESTDPYHNAGDSDINGPDGTFDYSGNPPGGFNDFSFPAISAVDTGFVTLYNPNAAQLKALSDYLWSNSFDLNAFKKLFNDPMDLFLGLSIVPVAVPDGGVREVGIGLIGTGVNMTVAASQWVDVDCGDYDVPLFTDSYLDFDPYTSIEIYLPYIGTRTLKADEVMGHNLAIHYGVDILSGACVAWLDIDGHVTYCFMGQCATSIPIVSGDWTNLINGILSVVGGAVGGAVKGGVGGAIAGGVAAASAVAVADGKISVERSGSISSAGGLLAPQKPVLIISAPRLCKPADQNIFEGYPAYVTMNLSALTGFTVVENIHLQGIAATDAELAEIETLLMSGVIL